MKIKFFVLLFITFTLAFITTLCVLLLPKYREYERIKNAKIEIELKDNREIPFGEKVYVEDFITSINGKVETNYEIDTHKLGKIKVEFEFTNEENILLPFSYEIEVIDNTPPIVWLSNSYSITTGFDGVLAEKILCADDTDDYPECSIEGEYDSTTPGSYDLKYIAKDKSGNTTEVPFTLYVRAPSQNNSSYNPRKLPFNEAISTYKKDNWQIGIDVSGWQGEIDFDKVKNAGVEFVIIRVGSKKGTNKEYFVDKEFERNIKGFNEVGIPVGIYFYSYAGSAREAKSDAEWVLEQIKDYKVDLPIAYDWEDWGSFNEYHLSLYSLTQNATAFLDTISKAGYKGMLYGSRNYLTSLWMETPYPVWLAHYTKETDYEGDYLLWQFSSSGLVDGINGDVDLDLMYKKEE